MILNLNKNDCYYVILNNVLQMIFIFNFIWVCFMWHEELR